MKLLDIKNITKKQAIAIINDSVVFYLFNFREQLTITKKASC